MKPSIYVTRQLPAESIELLNDFFEVSINPLDRTLTPAELTKALQNKDALLCLLTDQINIDILKAAPRLKVISNYAVGYNNIDINEANNRNIAVCITPGILTNATADLTWALILCVTRHMIPADRYTREGRFTGWSPTLFLGTDLFGKTLGIIGMGRIGQAVAKRAEGFGLKILYSSRTDKDVPYTRVPLETLLEQSDIVSLHTPLTEDTHHLIDKAALQRMKKTAYLINTTRGPVVDETSLIIALQKGWIAGAGLDVFEHEPQIPQSLIECPNTVLVPHIGSATTETRTQMAILAAENAIAVMTGNQPHAIVNPEVLTK